MTWTSIKYWLNKLNNGALIMGLFFLFVVISEINGCINMNKMSKRFKMTSGYIYKYDHGPKSLVVDLRYYYLVSNEKHNSFIVLNTENHDAFVGKYFPVLYDSTDPGVHKILITRSDFVEYGLVPPDSLAWVEKYVRY